MVARSRTAFAGHDARHTAIRSVRSEEGWAVLQSVFAIFFMLVVFFAVIDFGLLIYSMSTLQAQIQGAVSRTDAAAISSAGDPAAALKEQILADAGALRSQNLQVANVSLAMKETESSANVQRPADWATSVHREQRTVELHADISYLVPTLASIPGLPHVRLTYRLDADRVAFSQIELVAS